MLFEEQRMCYCIKPGGLRAITRQTSRKIWIHQRLSGGKYKEPGEQTEKIRETLLEKTRLYRSVHL